MNNQVTEYIENATVEQREIMKAIRTLIQQTVPNVTEEFKWSRPVFKKTKDFAYFLTTKNYVTVGFTKDFEKLYDPNKLLEGTGKTMRHIKLKTPLDINSKLLKEWFKIVTAE